MPPVVALDALVAPLVAPSRSPVLSDIAREVYAGMASALLHNRFLQLAKHQLEVSLSWCVHRWNNLSEVLQSVSLRRSFQVQRITGAFRLNPAMRLFFPNLTAEIHRLIPMVYRLLRSHRGDSFIDLRREFFASLSDLRETVFRKSSTVVPVGYIPRRSHGVLNFLFDAVTRPRVTADFGVEMSPPFLIDVAKPFSENLALL